MSIVDCKVLDVKQYVKRKYFRSFFSPNGQVAKNDNC